MFQVIYYLYTNFNITCGVLYTYYTQIYFIVLIIRLILIAEKDKVYEEFPTPLINRLEKHFVVTSTVLTGVQKELLTELEAWVDNYACIGLVAILKSI